ncbi:hypothetical protein GN956_G8340 [Arapaima gigas]
MRKTSRYHMLCSMANTGCLLLSGSGMLPHSLQCPPAFLYLPEGPSAREQDSGPEMRAAALADAKLGVRQHLTRRDSPSPPQHRNLPERDASLRRIPELRCHPDRSLG